MRSRTPDSEDIEVLTDPQVLANWRGILLAACLSQRDLERMLGCSAGDAEDLRMRALADLHRINHLIPRQ